MPEYLKNQLARDEDAERFRRPVQRLVMPTAVDPLEELDKMAADAKRIAADHVSFEFVSMGNVAYEWAYRLERMAALLREANRAA